MVAHVLDFTNVKESSGVNPKRQPAGDYLVKITAFEEKDAQNGSGNRVWTFNLQDVNMVSAVYPYRCVMKENSLWKLRNLIVATGKAVPQKRFKFDPESLIGKEVGVTLEDDEYEGKEKSEVSAVFPKSDLPEYAEPTSDADDDDDDDEDEEEEEPEPAPKKKVKKKAEPEPVKKAKKKATPPPADDDDDDEDEDEDLDELDIDDL